jgi:hypothetical protein
MMKSAGGPEKIGINRINDCFAVSSQKKTLYKNIQMILLEITE